jgi:predicted MFS family arabinose efflux permease
VAGLTGLSVYAPVLAAPWLGALVDRLPRRPMLIWVNVVLVAAFYPCSRCALATRCG